MTDDLWREPVDECIREMEAQLRREGTNADTELRDLRWRRFVESSTFNSSEAVPTPTFDDILRFRGRLPPAQPLLTSLSENASGLVHFELLCSCGILIRGSFIGDAVIQCRDCDSVYNSRTFTRFGYLNDPR